MLMLEIVAARLSLWEEGDSRFRPAHARPRSAPDALPRLSTPLRRRHLGVLQGHRAPTLRLDVHEVGHGHVERLREKEERAERRVTLTTLQRTEKPEGQRRCRHVFLRLPGGPSGPSKVGAYAADEGGEVHARS